MQKRAGVAALSLLAFVFVAADSGAGLPTGQDPTCFWSCAPIEGPPTETGTFPPGVSLTVVPGNSTAGGTNTRPACDDCLACKQGFLIQYDTNGALMIWWIDDGSFS